MLAPEEKPANRKQVISCSALDISEYSKEWGDEIYISFPLRSLLDLLPVEGAFITEIPINTKLRGERPKERDF